MEQLSGAQKPLQVVQFTDTHFFGSPEGKLMGVDTSFTFDQVVRLAMKQRGAPDFYLLTGDLSQDETPESYRRFSRAVRNLQSPVFYLPGNHDIQALMQESFLSQDAPFRTDNSFIEGSWQVILLDSHVEGQVAGHLKQQELDRLETTLTTHSTKHALVVLHHHPLPSGAKWLDGIGVENSAELFNIIDRHSQVRAVLFGHIHQEMDEIRKGVRYMATPSTCVQFKPRTTVFAVDAVAPGYRWLELFADGTIRSAVSRVSSVAPGLDLASAGY